MQQLFNYKQRPTDFVSLINPTNRVPSNVDGITERLGRFLIFEIKRQGENLSEGQRRMLVELSKLEQFTVLIVDSFHKLTDMEALDFRPYAFRIMANGIEGDGVLTDQKDFARRYEQWCRFPKEGWKHWTEDVCDVN